MLEFSPLDLRRLGFDLKNVSNGFRFRFVKTQDEYEEVLKLRYKSYLQAGKVDETKTFLDMGTSLDHLSRIIVAYHGSRLVGSVAVAFPDSDDLVLDTEKAFPNGYPNPMPAKTKMIEIARLCTDSDYRRSDLLLRILEYTYKVFVCGNREFVISSADDILWPLYKRIGFKKTGMSYAHPYLAGVIHHVIIGSRKEPDKAAGVSILAWLYVWRDMNRFLRGTRSLRLNSFQKTKIKFLETIGKLFRIRSKQKY
jgi:hypothetical protein